MESAVHEWDANTRISGVGELEMGGRKRGGAKARSSENSTNIRVFVKFRGWQFRHQKPWRIKSPSMNKTQKTLDNSDKIRIIPRPGVGAWLASRAEMKPDSFPNFSANSLTNLGLSV